ncbi:NADPH2:quinone reductase [Palleronia aestuarii]|uniref:NADPH2:quinone reductase n=1 Tax=Palleronia aestuarii TaxID=568105 RepID=A0A2W7NK30_9RHOB|nr:NADPH:quinone oxidoreductase family protein [Palleronia aestuarii]PZX18437.1 NADPH2:quinone reductase [Palleronia aestuarii]
MQALQVHSHTQQPQMREIDCPPPKTGEIRLKIAACGLNFADLLLARGSYQERPALPFTLGLEVAGTIDAVGSDDVAFAPGDRVAVYAGQGGLAHFGVFDADRAIRLPDTMPFDIAAGFQIAYGTAHLALDRRARLARGETLVILGAAGGVGLAAVEIGRHLGARVIAVARGRQKLSVAQEAGAHYVIDAETPDLRAALLDLGGCDVVFDAVGGEAMKHALRACRPEGRALVVGFASGTVPEVALNHLLVKNTSLIGIYWGAYAQFAPEVLKESLATLMKWHADGHLRPHISQHLPFERASEGLALLRERKATGKIVITMG